MMSGRVQKDYTTTMGCFLHVLKKEGIKGFYKGGLTNVFKGMGGALILVLYDKRESITSLLMP